MIRCYFDHASTSGGGGTASPPYIFGNPSSQHAEGRRAFNALEAARKGCAASLGVSPDQIFFTSGGTESNSIVLFSLLRHFIDAGVKRNIVTSWAEHPSVLENCKTLQKMGFPLHFIKLNKDGGSDQESLKNTLLKLTSPPLISLMAVNNESGSISNIAELVNTARNLYASSSKTDGRKVFFHTDIVQAIGKVPLSLSDWDVDAASISGHKLGAPRGSGILYLKKTFIPLVCGGHQESGIRPGTQNVALAESLQDALENAVSSFKKNFAEAAKRMDYLVSNLAKIERCTLLPQSRMDNSALYSPYILQAAFKNLPGAVMQRLLDDAGFAVSTGSACTQGSAKRPVLKAMGIKDDLSINGLRISQGFSTTQGEVESLISAIKEILSKYA